MYMYIYMYVCMLLQECGEDGDVSSSAHQSAEV